MSAILSDIQAIEKRALEDIAQLSVEDIVKTIQTIVEMENRLIRSTRHLLSRGSTSQVYRLVQELRDRDQALAEEICDWAIRNALNPYVPFGTYNTDRITARNLEEYYSLRAARFARQAERERLDQERAARRRAERSYRHAARQALHAELKTERNRIIEPLDRLDAIERLCLAVRDDHHPLWFYPERYAVVSSEEIERIDPVTRSRLLQKLVNAPRGPWRQLRQTLLKMPEGNA